ncbi:phytanoyl-CoA dioxygenase family protein [Streptomyces sp. NPDC048389]|uniref:phytanoyl-CoA dioxygenase family protein n=1 Tax=Streptomyces sp. NPDC048389 TaxID=3154622 RepID=UPI00345320AE
MSPSDQHTRGFVLFRRLFGPAETAALGQAAEAVLARVTEQALEGTSEVSVWPDGHRLGTVDGTTVHWEPGARPPAVRSLAPVTHLNPGLDALWTDERLTGPMRRLLGTERLGPFTSKLNFKRAGVGSEFRWHQDHPYWYCSAGPDAQDIATAMIFLDEATADNGALQIVPGSHLAGPAPRDRAEPTGLLVDTARTGVDGAVTVLAPAGSVLRDAAVAGLLDIAPGTEVALIGVVNPLVAAIREQGGVPLPCDLNLRTTNWGDPVTDDMHQVLTDADAVIATGMTFSNGSFDVILEHCRKHATPLAVYAQTGSAVARAFLGAGLTALSAEPFPFSQFSADATALYRYRAERA